MDLSNTCAASGRHYDEVMFFLTRREQTVAVMILVALVIGAGVRHIRLMAMMPGAVTHEGGVR